eukprot:CAMPEP_0194031064 /NCGR_PEP_ID=MMETSP0009_2-20130614/4337_1 /TAXON_ID=210454 /ORGANISM="Grammatophora oceanica, Strain CCMP 410" /LENGTH=91 /DNA_ID=CAMNT_0038671129 /DNA_START=29 /DNA_END=304 /DNA_ORIENTATION=+
MPEEEGARQRESIVIIEEDDDDEKNDNSSLLEERDALDELVRQETQRHLDAAWDAHRRLMRACLPNDNDICSNMVSSSSEEKKKEKKGEKQ